MPNHPIGVIFDWDGVIIDSHNQHELSWQRLAKEYNKDLPNNFFKETFGMRNESIIPKFFNNWIDTNNNKEVKILADRKEEIYRQIITQNGITPLEGVKELLASLKSQKIRCSIGSSTPIKNIERVINIIGLSDYFDAITAAEDVSNGKPDPEVFLKASKKIGIAPENCIVFEDAHVGIQAAIAAGMKVVAVATTHGIDQLSKAHLAVESLEKIKVEGLYKLFKA
ncbi:MAG: HAD family hydrolase [Verrucomicrobiales bacterium]